jgi:norsolorinic acid ketoreductase
MLEHYKINTIGPLLLFQATLPLLNAATKPKFVIMSSGAASIPIMDQLPFDTTPYCCSKVAANDLAKKIQCEHPNLIAFPLNSGWLETDMGLEVAKHVPPVPELPMGSLEVGVKGIIERLDGVTMEVGSGTFITPDWQMGCSASGRWTSGRPGDLSSVGQDH